VIVYQEQVMQISQIIGGYTLGGADMLRRAMGKKKADEMAKHRETIADGARKKGYDPALAEQLFDLMTKFAEYGFNKSHTAAYAVVTYHTAWLKAYHCSAFMAATMSSDLDNTDTIKIFYEDTIANRIVVLPPDVNTSDYRFVPTDAKTIRYGLGAVKGVGEPAVRAILAAPGVRTLQGSLRFLLPHGQAHGQPPGHRGPGACRRLRHHRPGAASRPSQAAGQRRHGHGGGRTDCRAMPCRAASSTSRRGCARRWPTT
jgi:DNA polymerase III alpha subunit